jgi:hypothetical protein
MDVGIARGPGTERPGPNMAGIDPVRFKPSHDRRPASRTTRLLTQHGKTGPTIFQP